VAEKGVTGERVVEVEKTTTEDGEAKAGKIEGSTR
jgi:hypothetical protein